MHEDFVYRARVFLVDINDDMRHRYFSFREWPLFTKCLAALHTGRETGDLGSAISIMPTALYASRPRQPIPGPRHYSFI